MSCDTCPIDWVQKPHIGRQPNEPTIPVQVVRQWQDGAGDLHVEGVLG